MYTTYPPNGEFPITLERPQRNLITKWDSVSEGKFKRCRHPQSGVIAAGDWPAAQTPVREGAAPLAALSREAYTQRDWSRQESIRHSTVQAYCRSRVWEISEI
jgi:hypothetical protein